MDRAVLSNLLHVVTHAEKYEICMARSSDQKRLLELELKGPEDQLPQCPAAPAPSCPSAQLLTPRAKETQSSTTLTHSRHNDELCVLFKHPININGP